MSGRLVCRLRAGVTLSFELREAEAVLGREPGLAVALPAEGVSRRHARITWDGKSHWVEDLRSTNGTFVNGHPVAREKLRHLDVVTLGKWRGARVPDERGPGAARAEPCDRASAARRAGRRRRPSMRSR